MYPKIISFKLHFLINREPINQKNRFVTYLCLSHRNIAIIRKIYNSFTFSKPAYMLLPY